jgi:hypothetical protein
VLVEAAPADIALFRNTTGAPTQFLDDPVGPERDCGVLELGVDAYYKIANDLIDNGNFGQALVLSAFPSLKLPASLWPWDERNSLRVVLAGISSDDRAKA